MVAAPQPDRVSPATRATYNELAKIDPRNDGKLLWQTKLTNYVEHQGYGSSPAIHGPLVIVSADNKAGGDLLARITGVRAVADRSIFPDAPAPDEEDYGRTAKWNAYGAWKAAPAQEIAA